VLPRPALTGSRGVRNNRESGASSDVPVPSPKRQDPIGSAPARRTRLTVRVRAGALSIGPFEGSRSGCGGRGSYAFSIDMRARAWGGCRVCRVDEDRAEVREQWNPALVMVTKRIRWCARGRDSVAGHTWSRRAGRHASSTANAATLGGVRNGDLPRELRKQLLSGEPLDHNHRPATEWTCRARRTAVLGDRW